jgi:hypothetical protein
MTVPAMSKREVCADCGRVLPRSEDGGSSFVWCFGCTASRLAERVENLAVDLLPGGHLENRRWWRAGDITGIEGQSLALELAGLRRGRWCDFAGGEGGDLLDLVRQSPRTGCNGNHLKSLRWAHDYLRAPVRERRMAWSRSQRHEEGEEGEEGKIDYAKRLWREGRLLQRGDAGWRYLLETRAIELDALPQIPALRMHPQLRAHHVNQAFPALLAAVTAPSGGRIVGIHRTWLCPRPDGLIDKAPIPDPKRSIGAIRGNLIPLLRGSGERPLLALAEGIEDALSIAAARPDWRIACAVSLSNMLGLTLPEQVAELILIVQNDPANSKAAMLLSRIVKNFQHQGRKVHTLRPKSRNVKDVNDVVRLLQQSDGTAAPLTV